MMKFSKVAPKAVMLTKHKRWLISFTRASLVPGQLVKLLTEPGSLLEINASEMLSFHLLLMGTNVFKNGQMLCRQNG